LRSQNERFVLLLFVLRYVSGAFFQRNKLAAGNVYIFPDAPLTTFDFPNFQLIRRFDYVFAQELF